MIKVISLRSNIRVIINIILLILLGSSVANAQDSIDPEIEGFLDLLKSRTPPTLSDYIKYYGEGSEVELGFEIEECRTRKWEFDSENCKQFINERWSNSDSYNSLFFEFLRTKFSTVGKDFKILGTEEFEGDFSYSIVTVCIGGNEFRLFKNLSDFKATGINIGVSSINGEQLNAYLSTQK